MEQYFGKSLENNFCGQFYGQFCKQFCGQFVGQLRGNVCGQCRRQFVRQLSSINHILSSGDHKTVKFAHRMGLKDILVLFFVLQDR